MIIRSMDHVARSVPADQTVYVFCDESRQTSGPYMLFGSMWIPAEALLELQTNFSAVRASHGMTAAMEWKKVSPQKVDAYLAFIDVALGAFLIKRTAAFRCLILKASQIDHNHFNQGDAELGYYKFLHQLLYQHMLASNDYHVRLDRRANRVGTRLGDLRLVLNRRLRRDKGCDGSAVRTIQPLSTKEHDCMQAVDIITGAVGFCLEKCHDRPGANMAKIAVMEHVAQRLGRKDLAFGSRPSEKYFNLWHFRLEEPQRRSAPTPIPR